MSQIDELLAANAAHVDGYAVAGDGPPRRRLAVLTCMDARVDPLAALGLAVGDAHVLRNAGAASPTTCCAASSCRRTCSASTRSS